jgi:hypothetical protein
MRPRSRRFALRATFAAAMTLLLTSAVRADPPMGGAPAPEGKPDAKPDAAPKADALKTIPDSQAAPLLEGLKKVAKAKTAADALPAFDALAGLTHPDFEAALAKHLGHSLRDVAVRAAAEVGKRPSPKTGATLWKGWTLAINDKRPDVRGGILTAMGAAGIALDGKQYAEVEALWKKAADVPSMLGIATYFKTIATDKRPCRILAEWLDEPRAGGNVEDGSNPPAEWWEARWKTWSAVKGVVAEALKAITGQTFHSKDEAKEWFEKNPKFGFTW